MAEAFLQVLIEDLSSLIQREIGLIMGVDKEMKKLSSTLTTIQSVLEDAEDKQLQSKPIQNWLIKVNDIAYEIEDILDDCATEVSKLERKGSIFNFKKILFRHKTGRRMKEVAEKLDAVAAERHNFHLPELVVPHTSQVDARSETGSVLNEPDHIYGRDEDREKIVDILVNQVADCQQLSVLPIIGVGGLGKTTLAQLVFNDERVSQHFDTKLWVCVSDNFDLKILLKAMIASASGSAPDLVPLEVLQCCLREVLNHKRYLLILDDVWNDNQEDWIKLKSILACGSEGASVAVTTRLAKVAAIMGTLPAHCLTGLSEEDCWLLFRLKAFGRENEEHPNLETIGRQIVKKCAGVPLGAKALGGLLRFRRKEKEWIQVKESEIWNLSEEESLILPALRLSYYHLPLVLRRCFVYCAVFPKDSIIEEQNLIFRWMAHGYISSNGTQEVEDVGDQIWNELVLRSFFHEVSVGARHTIFKMHDLIHDLARSIMENKIHGAHTSSISGSNNKIREVHLSEHTENRPSSIIVQVQGLATIMNYSSLRVLNLSQTRMENLPSAIGKLKHLREIDLSVSSIRSLPHTFCHLWNLQILILNYCPCLKSLPEHIRCLSNLRHILLEGCLLSHMPSRIRELTFLKTLSLFIVGHKTDSQLDELEFLNLGGRLQIKHLERIQNHGNAKKANLVKKPNLLDLVLHWEGDSTSELAKMMDENILEALEPHPNLETLGIDGFKGSYFPLWMTKMENVSNIAILNCPNCLHLPLGDLPCLKFLSLSNLAALEYIVEDEIQGQNSVHTKFPSLEELRLGSLPNLKGLLKEEVGEMFPNLRSIYITDCQLLILPSLSTLEQLNAKKCRLSTLFSFSKFQNLASLVLDFDKNMMTCIPEGRLQHLTALENLSICNCSELVELPEEIKHLRLLKRLLLSHVENMVSLPQGLQCVPSLQSLKLMSLPQLTSLPDWLGNLTSLTQLEIVNCQQVTLLPSSIQGMTNLRFLYISGCPQLERRYEKGKGEDWHKIVHIPQLHV